MHGQARVPFPAAHTSGATKAEAPKPGGPPGSTKPRREREELPHIVRYEVVGAAEGRVPSPCDTPSTQRTNNRGLAVLRPRVGVQLHGRVPEAAMHLHREWGKHVSTSAAACTTGTEEEWREVGTEMNSCLILKRSTPQCSRTALAHWYVWMCVTQATCPHLRPKHAPTQPLCQDCAATAPG